LSLQHLLPFIGTFGDVQVDVGPFVSGSPHRYSIFYRSSGRSRMFNPILRGPMSHTWVSIALVVCFSSYYSSSSASSSSSLCLRLPPPRYVLSLSLSLTTTSRCLSISLYVLRASSLENLCNAKQRQVQS
jgi:hypothetical protein